MTDSTGPDLEERIDRYVRGELTATEARALAQESLDSRELFEELTFSALAKTALAAPTAPAGKIVRFPRKVRFAVASAAAAAALLISLYSLNWRPAAQNQSRGVATGPPVTPALASSAKPGQPVLLMSVLQPGPSGEGTAVFRGAEPASRSPQPTGAIVSIEDGLAAIDLGSLDGLAKGSELRIFRDERSTQAVGRLMVTTVFRERARGRIVAGQEIRLHNRVRVAGATHVGALLEQVDRLSKQGDPDAARRMAERAAEWAEAASLPPGEVRKVLERLGALEYQAGSLPPAEKHYQSVVDSLNAEPPASLQEQSTAFNNLAVLHMLRGDYNGAEAPLGQAVSLPPKTDVARGRGLNNLGVLAELRGDRRKAEALYTDALRVFAGAADSPAQERRAVETNLARLRGPR
jgi:tetratricopeptide (TPR) repeat protein